MDADEVSFKQASSRKHASRAGELLAELLSAEQDEAALLNHLRRVRDNNGLDQLRKVRQRIANLGEKLANELQE